MFDSSNDRSRRSAKLRLGERLRQLRLELHGESGVVEFSDTMNLPLQTWLNYERGVTIPGEVLLVLLVLTRAEPLWLLRGEGTMFRASDPDGVRRPAIGVEG